MKSASTGAASGCLVWLIVFGGLSTCLCPFAAAAGGLTANFDPVVGLVGPWFCPKGSTATIHTFDTTGTDTDGTPIRTTGSEMVCVDASGTVVTNAGPTYALVWVGILLGAGLVVAAILSVVLAVPAGVAFARWSNRRASAPVGRGTA